MCVRILSSCLGHLQTQPKCLVQLWAWRLGRPPVWLWTVRFPSTLARAPAGRAGLLWEAFERLARQGGARGSGEVALAARLSLQGGDQVPCLRALHAFACCEGCDAREASGVEVLRL